MRVLVGLMGLAALGLAPAAAEAASVTYSQFYPADNNPDPGRSTQTFSPADWDGTTQGVTLPRFNPALGRLTGIDLGLYGNINSSGTLTNNGATAADVSLYSAAMDITLLAPGTSVPWDQGDGGLLTVSPSLFTIFNRVIEAGQSVPFNTDTPFSSFDSNVDAFSVPLSPDEFAPYVGAGTLLFPLFATTNTTQATDGGDLTLSPVTAARAQASITYTYDLPSTEVPEPVSSAVLGVGLLSLCLARRRG